MPTVRLWAEASKREVAYALCNDRRTLLWFANQRAVEYHPTLTRIERPDRATHLVLDLDPPEAGRVLGGGARWRASCGRRSTTSGCDGAVKTSGAKGLHVFVPVDDALPLEDSAAVTRAIAARAASLDPDIATTAFIKEDREGQGVRRLHPGRRARRWSARTAPGCDPGCRCRSPSSGTSSTAIAPGDFTVHTALEQLEGRTPWAELMADRQSVPASLVEEGHEIPVARVQAMHEGKRRARARRTGG